MSTPEMPLREAAEWSNPVSGLTHDFYRYPARFSPVFARAAINTLSSIGDCVFDPFMGGGTTLVESRILGRRGVGSDINQLSIFLAKAKNLILSETELLFILDWADNLNSRINLHNPPIRPSWWIEHGYQKNICGRTTWPIRKATEFILHEIDRLPHKKFRVFARCALLKTAQWGIDCRTNIPPIAAFKAQFLENIFNMALGCIEYAKEATKADRLYKANGIKRLHFINKAAEDMESFFLVNNKFHPKLVLTSPPYPGVHVLYHRWQINGRKETAAPFWIANSLDSKGESFYTMGSRKEKRLDKYYSKIYLSFKSIANIANKETLIVQMVGFSDVKNQLNRYLDAMKSAGLVEILFKEYSNFEDGRLWRSVPNRKWYAQFENSISSSKEVVLFHKKAHKI